MTRTTLRRAAKAAAVHTNRTSMILWMALRVARQAKHSNELADAAYDGLCAALRRQERAGGSEWFQRTDQRQRDDESLLWISSEMRNMVKARLTK